MGLGGSKCFWESFGTFLKKIQKNFNFGGKFWVPQKAVFNPSMLQMAENDEKWPKRNEIGEFRIFTMKWALDASGRSKILLGWCLEYFLSPLGP